jgi:hypothetical protein
MRINDKSNDILAMVVKNMPIHTKDRLLSNITRIFGKDFKYTDTFEEGIDNSFPCAHYTWYNRFSNQVSYILLLLIFLIFFFQRKDEDETQPIAEYQQGGKKRINTCLFIPRPSKELRDGGERYNLLQECFQEVFDWIHDLV